MMRRLLFAIATLVAMHSTQVQGAMVTTAPWRQSRSAVNQSQVLSIVLALKRHNMEQLEALFWSISDPRSKGYGNRMSTEAVRALISPGAAAIGEVTRWLKKHGVAEVEVSAHEDYMKVAATVGQLEELFGLQFKVFEDGNGRELTRSMDRVVIPEEFADVIALVQGVTDLPPPPTKKKRMADNGGGNREVTPKVLMDAYNITGHEPKPIAGKRNIQAYYAYSNFVTLSDLQIFCQKYLPDIPAEDCNITKILGPNEPGSGIFVEANLDSQYIFGVSGGAETWVYSTEGSYSPYSFCSSWSFFSQQIFKESTYPFVVSMSYGEYSNQFGLCTPDEIKVVEEDWKKLGALGVTIIVSSGDYGTNYNNTGLGGPGFFGQILYPQWPASSPYVTAVGATNFQHATGFAQMSACNYPECSYGWSGGGFAFNQDAPEYQRDTIERYVAAGKGLPPKECWASWEPKRGTPDVSVLGYNFAFVLGGFFTTVSGTSASAPSFAGMVTRLNWVRMKDEGKTLGFLNPLLYLNPGVFTDIVVGNNDNNNNGFGFDAVEGWDATTGLGVPNFGKMKILVESQNGKEGMAGFVLPQPVFDTLTSTDRGAVYETSIPLSTGDIWTVSSDGTTLIIVKQNITIISETGVKIHVYDILTTKVLSELTFPSGTLCTATSGPSSFTCMQDYSGVIWTLISRVGTEIKTNDITLPTEYGGSVLSMRNSGSSHCTALCQLSMGPETGVAWQVACFSMAKGAIVLNHKAPASAGSPSGTDASLYVSPDGTAAIVTKSGITQTTGNCIIEATGVGVANGNVFLAEDGLYDLTTCHQIKRIDLNGGENIYVIDETFIVLDYDALSAVSYNATGAAKTLVTGVSEGVFDNVIPTLFSSGRSALLNLQGKQYLIETAKGAATAVSPLGRIPSMPNSNVFSYEWSPMFDPVIHLRNGSILIPHMQGGTLLQRMSNNTLVPAHRYRESPMNQVKQGAGVVLYESMTGGKIIISEGFNPAKS